MNAQLNPTATDGCESGLHAFVDGRCRDCGALKAPAPFVTPVAGRTQIKRVLVEFDLDPTTRWRESEADTLRGMECVLEVFGRIWTRGPIPAVRVRVLPDGSVTAPASKLIGGGSESRLSEAATPAR